MTTLKRACGYIRVSDVSQIEGQSLDAQREEIKRYCQQQGYDLTNVYTDEGISAFTDKINKRPQFSRLLHDAEGGNFDIVVVHTLDRWSRNMRIQTAALQRLGDAKVGFVSIAENFDLTTPAGRMLLSTIGAANEFLSGQTGVHVAKVRKAAVEHGLPAGPLPSIGYRRESPGGVPQVVPEEAELVRGAFDRSLAGETDGQIADWLHKHGVKTSADNRPTPHFVKDFLSLRIFTGVVTYKGQEFPGQHEPIIDPDTFDRLRAHRATRRRHPRKQYAGPAGLWHARLYCLWCEHAITSERDSRGRPRYRERHAPDCRTNNRSRAAYFFDDQAKDIITATDLPADWRQRMSEGAIVDESREDPADLRRRKTRLLDRYERDDAMTRRQLDVKLAALNDRIRQAEQTTAIDLEDAAALFADLPALWDEATVEERQRLIAPLIERAYADIETHRIGAIIPTPGFADLLQHALVGAGRTDVQLLAPSECVTLGVVETGEN